MPGNDADASDADLWLQRLHPIPGVAIPEPASRPTTVADAVERLGKDPVEWACQVGYAMTERIIAEIPDFGGGPEQFESLPMGPESSVIHSLIWISSKGEGMPAITEEALRGDVDFVRRGISLDKVLRGVRLGHAQMTKAFLDSCRELVPEAERVEQMQIISENLFRYIDDFSGEMAATYLSERERWTVSAAAAKAEIIRHVLDGSRSDRAEASRQLGYDLSRQQVALTLWFDPVRNSADTRNLKPLPWMLPPGWARPRRWSCRLAADGCGLGAAAPVSRPDPPQVTTVRRRRTCEWPSGHPGKTLPVSGGPIARRKRPSRRSG